MGDGQHELAAVLRRVTVNGEDETELLRLAAELTELIPRFGETARS